MSATKIYNGNTINHAVASDGKRYSELATAFVYRERIIPGCTWQGRLRPHYQYDSFQECNQAREAMAKDETGRHLWATCTRGKAPPPSVYQKEFQDQLMSGSFLKERR